MEDVPESSVFASTEPPLQRKVFIKADAISSTSTLPPGCIDASQQLSSDDEEEEENPPPCATKEKKLLAEEEFLTATRQKLDNHKKFERIYGKGFAILKKMGFEGGCLGKGGVEGLAAPIIVNKPRPKGKGLDESEMATTTHEPLDDSVVNILLEDRHSRKKKPKRKWRQQKHVQPNLDEAREKRIINTTTTLVGSSSDDEVTVGYETFLLTKQQRLERLKDEREKVLLSRAEVHVVDMTSSNKADISAKLAEAHRTALAAEEKESIADLMSFEKAVRYYLRSCQDSMDVFERRERLVVQYINEYSEKIGLLQGQIRKINNQIERYSPAVEAFLLLCREPHNEQAFHDVFDKDEEISSMIRGLGLDWSVLRSKVILRATTQMSLELFDGHTENLSIWRKYLTTAGTDCDTLLRRAFFPQFNERLKQLLGVHPPDAVAVHEFFTFFFLEAIPKGLLGESGMAEFVRAAEQVEAYVDHYTEAYKLLIDER